MRSVIFMTVILIFGRHEESIKLTRQQIHVRHRYLSAENSRRVQHQNDCRLNLDTI